MFVSLKAHGAIPGDMSSEQMDAVAELAQRFSFGLVRVTHTQNLLLADVRQRDLKVLWGELDRLKLAMPNIGTLTDMIACPGLDFCSLANAGTLDVAKSIQQRFDDLDYLYDLGEIEIKMSGCMNACGHHHVGHIGILGVDKHGEEWYQITLGGSASGFTALGRGHRPLGAQERGGQHPRAHRRGVPPACAPMASASSTPCIAWGSSRSRSRPMRHILRQHEAARRHLALPRRGSGR